MYRFHGTVGGAGSGAGSASGRGRERKGEGEGVRGEGMDGGRKDGWELQSNINCTVYSMSLIISKLELRRKIRL